MSKITVLAVVSEIFPLVKTGGLADVAGALPTALTAEDVEVVTLVPGYPAVMRAIERAETAIGPHAAFGGHARVLRADAGGLDLFVLEAPHLFARAGGPYTAPDGTDWPDNPLRFAALARAGADLALGAASGFSPDIVHAHDWQAGLTAAYLQYDPRPIPGTVMTVHNLAFQGKYPAELLGPLGLPAAAFSIEGVEYFGAISFLKAGLAYSDRITTVSPTYAAEIRTPDYGMGLDGLLRARGMAVSGILNGIDEDIWDPCVDELIAEPFSVATLANRPVNKAFLQQRIRP